ncbi:MAG TPA: serine hydrolase domain-containing protein [Chthonomonadaceae bacterium]|nr:serine hydrolase domain-containing protein [Chthonomonadaceae bacterium]
MNGEQHRFGRRTLLKRAFAGAFCMMAGGQSAPVEETMVTTGRYNPALDSFDRTMIDYMRKRNIPGGALAVSKDGRLVYLRGYGYADQEEKEPVQPDALFRIASISKPITAVAVLTLVQHPRIKLDLDAPAFPMLPIKPFLTPGEKVDPRLNAITIRQLLHHTGGFDRGQSFDPMYRSPIDIAAAVGVRGPADPKTILRYMMGRPLDFDPGTRFAYSNFGYCVLGRVIEALTGQTYTGYVQNHVLHPMRIERMRMGKTRLTDRAPGEVHYYQPNEKLVPSIFPEDGGKLVDMCYGGFYLEAMDAHGGWLASAPNLLRFAAGLDFPRRRPLLAPETHALLSEPPAPPVKPEGGMYYGCGWNTRPIRNTGRFNMWHNGGLPGTNTWLIKRWDGLAWAALFNQRETGNGLSDAEIDARLHPAADAVKDWPDVDLFER